MSDLLAEADRIAMNSLLAALCDPGRFVDRAPLEPLHSWQRRAVIEHAAPYILAVAEKRAAAAEGKLAAIERQCGKAAGVLRRGTGVPFSRQDVMVDARYILEIISTGGDEGNG